MKKNDYSEEYHINESLLNDEKNISNRIKESGLSGKIQLKTLGNLLKFLYNENHTGRAVRKTIRNYEHYFSEAERLMLYRLETRCTGSERYNYGFSAIKAIKRDKYSCVVCGEKDVRCLEIDHIDGRTHNKGSKEQLYETSHFQTLCANHHRIKTVVEKQQN